CAVSRFWHDPCLVLGSADLSRLPGEFSRSWRCQPDPHIPHPRFQSAGGLSDWSARIIRRPAPGARQHASLFVPRPSPSSSFMSVCTRPPRSSPQPSSSLALLRLGDRAFQVCCLAAAVFLLLLIVAYLVKRSGDEYDLMLTIGEMKNTLESKDSRGYST